MLVNVAVAITLTSLAPKGTPLDDRGESPRHAGGHRDELRDRQTLASSLREQATPAGRRPGEGPGVGPGRGPRARCSPLAELDPDALAALTNIIAALITKSRLRVLTDDIS